MVVAFPKSGRPQRPGKVFERWGRSPDSAIPQKFMGPGQLCPGPKPPRNLTGPRLTHRPSLHFTPGFDERAQMCYQAGAFDFDPKHPQGHVHSCNWCPPVKGSKLVFSRVEPVIVRRALIQKYFRGCPIELPYPGCPIPFRPISPLSLGGGAFLEWPEAAPA